MKSVGCATMEENNRFLTRYRPTRVDNKIKDKENLQE